MNSAFNSPTSRVDSQISASNGNTVKIENNLMIMNYTGNPKDAPLHKPSPMKSKEEDPTGEKFKNLSLKSSNIIAKYGSSKNFGLYNKKEINQGGETKTLLEIRPATGVGKKMDDPNKIRNRPVTAYRGNFNNKNITGSSLVISPGRGIDSKNAFFYDKYVSMTSSGMGVLGRKGDGMNNSASSKGLSGRVKAHGLGTVEHLSAEINAKRGLVPRFGLPSENEKILTRQFVFCLHCKKNLGPGNRVIPHTGADGKEGEGGPCDVVFVKKFDWVKMDPYSMSAKIQCPSCHSVIGDSKFTGVKCGCGHHEVPGYSLLKNKILFK